MTNSRITLALFTVLTVCAQQTMGPLTNPRIGDMVLAGVSANEIIRIIASAPVVSFDLRPGSTDNLLKVGVSEAIIKAMAAREAGVGTPIVNAPTFERDKHAVPVEHHAETIYSTQAITSKDWLLHEGTPVRLRIMRTVSSASVLEGDNVDFETLDDIVVNGLTVLPKSSIALATVTVAESKKRMGRGGKLGMNIDYVRLPTGDKLALRGVRI